MRLFLVLSLFFCLLGCKDSATAQRGDTVVGTVDTAKKLRLNPEDVGKAPQSLFLRLGDAEAATGQEVCLPVEASNFTDLIGFQFTMRFDSAALKFEEFRSFQLPGYNQANFGTRFAERGYLSTLWTEPSLVGTTKADGFRLFEVCFTNLQEPGEQTEIWFADGPTAFEVIRSDMQPLTISYANGVVGSR